MFWIERRCERKGRTMWERLISWEIADITLYPIIVNTHLLPHKPILHHLCCESPAQTFSCPHSFPRRHRDQPGLAEQTRDRVRGLRPDGEPVFRAVQLQTHVFVAVDFGFGIVMTYDLYVSPVPRSPAIRDVNAVKGQVTVAVPRQADAHRHRSYSTPREEE